MPPSKDEASLDDNEFVVPEDPVEQERFKCRLRATASSLKKKQQQLRADQDLLADRWTEVLAAEEYKLERPSKSYPKRRLLPQLEEEATKPTSPAYDAPDRPPRGHDREAFRPSNQAAPRRRSKYTRARGNATDLQDILEDKARQTRSIYGSRGHPMTRDDNRHAGYSKTLLEKSLLMAHWFCLLMAHYQCAISSMPLVFFTNGADRKSVV